MSKIVLVADEIKDENNFIIKLRAIEKKSILEIKTCLRNKRPFFIGDPYYSKKIQKQIREILKFSKEQGNTIKLYRISRKDNPNEPKESDEVTEQQYDNMLESRRMIARDTRIISAFEAGEEFNEEDDEDEDDE